MMSGSGFAMTTVDDIKSDIIRAANDQRRALVCISIVEYILERLPDKAEFLTVRTLCNVTEKRIVDDELLHALAILCGSRIDALDAGAMLIDEELGEFEIDSDDWRDARASGVLIHPVTGREIKDYQSVVIPIFYPSAKLRGVAGHG